MFLLIIIENIRHYYLNEATIVLNTNAGSFAESQKVLAENEAAKPNAIPYICSRTESQSTS